MPEIIKPVRSIPPREKPSCPQCHCFVRLDAGTCTACGYAFALASGTRRAETRPFVAQVADCQSGPQGNAQSLENLLPNGKLKKPKKPKNSDQLVLFPIPETSFDFREVL